jgi:hypothetical protein
VIFWKRLIQKPTIPALPATVKTLQNSSQPFRQLLNSPPLRANAIPVHPAEPAHIQDYKNYERKQGNLQL